VVVINGCAAEDSVRQTGSSTVPLLVETISPRPRTDVDRRRLRHLLDRLLGLRIDMTQRYQTAARDARPYAGLGYVHLLLDGLSQAGALDSSPAA
jgi:hypothetical protein